MPQRLCQTSCLCLDLYYKLNQEFLIYRHQLISKYFLLKGEFPLVSNENLVM